MSASSIITQGLGPWGSPSAMLTLGLIPSTASGGGGAVGASAILTLGVGPWGSPADIITLGFDQGIAVEEPEPLPEPSVIETNVRRRVKTRRGRVLH